MQKTLEEKLSRIVADGEVYLFTVPVEAVYGISITARAKNWAQNIRQLFNDDDLAIQIDGVPFYEYMGKQKEFSSPGSWNGNQLAKTYKTNWYLLPLASGSHSITFVVDGAPFVQHISVSNLGDLNAGVVFDVETLPKDEENGLFFDVIIKNVNLQSTTISANATDSDIQCSIDGIVQEDATSKRYRKFFCRNNEKTLTKQFASSEHLHTIALIGRGSPTLNQIRLETAGYRLVQHGKIAMYEDIDPYPRAQLRTEATKMSNSLGELDNGEKIEILETRVEGQMELGKSNIWHRVKSRLGEGYVLSSFVEIEGQERGIIVQKIKKKAQEIGVDAELMLLLAGVESRYKPYATSIGAKGIFQLMPDAITEVKKSENFEVNDPFDADQSIEGGLRYLHWLQRKWYHPPVKDWRIKLFLAYNQGHTHVPEGKDISISRIPLRYQKQATDHLQHYRNNIKGFNWKNILLSILLLSGVGIAGVTGKEPMSGVIVTQQTANVASSNSGTDKLPDIPRGEFVEGNSFSGGTVTIYRRDGKIAAEMPENEIILNDELPIKTIDKEWDRLTVDARVDEYPANTFYFFAANSGSCGSAGCAGGLYRIGSGETKPRLVAETSEIKNFVPSPDGRHVALVSQSRVEDELLLIDSQTLAAREIKFNVGNSHCAYVVLLSWGDIYTLEIESEELNCGSQSKIPSVEKTLRYHIDTGAIKTIDVRPHSSS